MALLKEKTLQNGAVGNYWRVSQLSFNRASMKVSIRLDLYKDSTVGLAPLGSSHLFEFTVTQQQLMGNLVSLAYTNIKAMIDATHPPISGVGEEVSYYPDLIGYVDA